jgi:apolipoprotein D and lipocalin family protein
MKTMNSFKKFFLMTFTALTIMTTLNSCKTTNELSTVQKVDITKYLGTWYEIARLPNRFEKDMKCVTATYSLKKNGKIKVLNKGFKITKNKYVSAKGTAWIPNNNFPGRLKVRFFWPFSGDYYIIALDENYQYALVGDPSRKYLWILSRTPVLDQKTYDMLVKLAKDKGFDTDNLLKIEHDCEK